MEVSVISAQKETCSRIVIAQSSAPLGLVHDPGAFLFSNRVIFDRNIVRRSVAIRPESRRSTIGTVYPCGLSVSIRAGLQSYNRCVRFSKQRRLQTF